MKNAVLFMAGVIALVGLSGCTSPSGPDGKYILPPQTLVKVLKDGNNYSLQIPANDSTPPVALTKVSDNEYTCKLHSDQPAKIGFVRNQQGEVVKMTITEKGETKTADKMASK